MQAPARRTGGQGPPPGRRGVGSPCQCGAGRGRDINTVFACKLCVVVDVAKRLVDTPGPVATLMVTGVTPRPLPLAQYTYCGSNLKVPGHWHAMHLPPAAAPTSLRLLRPCPCCTGPDPDPTGTGSTGTWSPLHQHHARAGEHHALLQHRRQHHLLRVHGHALRCVPVVLCTSAV